MQPIQIYLGIPQTQKLPVYDVKGRLVKVTQIIFSNTSAEDSKITVTVNTTDIMKNFVIKANETILIPMSLVLSQNNVLSLQQDKENAVNVTISGELYDF